MSSTNWRPDDGQFACHIQCPSSVSICRSSFRPTRSARPHLIRISVSFESFNYARHSNAANWIALAAVVVVVSFSANHHDCCRRCQIIRSVRCTARNFIIKFECLVERVTSHFGLGRESDAVKLNQPAVTSFNGHEKWAGRTTGCRSSQWNCKCQMIFPKKFERRTQCMVSFFEGARPLQICRSLIQTQIGLMHRTITPILAKPISGRQAKIVVSRRWTRRRRRSSRWTSGCVWVVSLIVHLAFIARKKQRRRRRWKTFTFSVFLSPGEYFVEKLHSGWALVLRNKRTGQMFSKSNFSRGRRNEDCCAEFLHAGDSSLTCVLRPPVLEIIVRIESVHGCRERLTLWACRNKCQKSYQWASRSLSRFALIWNRASERASWYRLI